MQRHESLILPSSGYSIAYHRAGKGQTILLVHGITTYSFIWRKIIPLLKSSYDVIALDLLGCGTSDKPLDVSYSLNEHADRLKEFADTIGINQFHLVGHDLGGGIAQIYSVRFPETLKTLTLVNSVAYDYWPVQPITALRTPIIRLFLMASLDFGTFRLIVERGLFHKERVTDDLMALFKEPFEYSEGRKAFLHFAKCLDNSNLTKLADKLRSMPVPTLLIRGDADVYLSSSIVEKLHAELPDARLARIATAGHFIQEDEPEWLADQLLGFIGEVHEK